MKILALGDTHGRPHWKKIVNENNFDKLIFIGDYFDSKEGILPEQQLSNFNEIIEFKKSNLEKVILLIGNHDFHYFPDLPYRYSGFQKEFHLAFQSSLKSVLSENLMQMAFRHEKFLFTHAGVTKTWLRNHGYSNEVDVDTFINDLFQKKISAFHFSPGQIISKIGNETCQTPIWVRPKSLFLDAMDGYTHVVGHTIRPSIFIAPGKMILIDTLSTSGEILEIKNGGAKAIKIE